MKEQNKTDHTKVNESEIAADSTQQSHQQESTSEIFHEDSLDQSQQGDKTDLKLKQALEKVQAELEAANDKYVRLYAEFENFRKRNTQEKLALIETAGEKILQQILPIIDDFERALASLHQENISLQAVEEGVQLIYDKMLHLLEQAGVEPMHLEKGSIFDPEAHEAITKMPVTEITLQGKVVNVIEKGYLLKNKHKVLRHAKVIIGE